MLQFEEKSLTVRIDTDKCTTCQTKACVAACKKYARGILSVDAEGKASIGSHSADEVLRLGTECLACEFACHFDGAGALKIEVPITGLDEYRKKRGLA